MIKPILYHSFEEKEILERDLMLRIPLDKRKSVSQTLAAIFSAPGEKAKRPRIKGLKIKTKKK
jgi:hypothetical protein